MQLDAFYKTYRYSPLLTSPCCWTTVDSDFSVCLAGALSRMNTTAEDGLQESVNGLLLIHAVDGLKCWLMFFVSRLSKYLAMDHDAKRMQEAKDKGNVNKATVLTGYVLGGAVAGALVGFFVVGPIGAAIGASVGVAVCGRWCTPAILREGRLGLLPIYEALAVLRAVTMSALFVANALHIEDFQMDPVPWWQVSSVFLFYSSGHAEAHFISGKSGGLKHMRFSIAIYLLVFLTAYVWQSLITSFGLDPLTAWVTKYAPRSATAETSVSWRGVLGCCCYIMLTKSATYAYYLYTDQVRCSLRILCVAHICHVFH